eukprot:gene5363-10719_t
MRTEERLQQARRIEDLSTILIDVGVSVIKKNPIPVGAYVFGILMCLFFSGFKVSSNQQVKFESKMRTIDYSGLDKLALELDYAEHDYRRSKGWFSCDTFCQENKRSLDNIRQKYNTLKAKIDQGVSDAKSELGIFSESGVGETRDLFWLRFSQGKGFATRQSKWDALFMGIGAMSRDEGMLSYLLRLLMSVLFNFTLGMFGTVIGFIFSLPGIIMAYQVPLLYACLFFISATLAAIAFAATWILGLYTAAAGAVYVGAKLVASNMRLEGGPGMGAERVQFQSGFNRRNFRE